MTIPAPLLEALKEGLRVIVLSLIPVVLIQLEQGSLNLKSIGLVGVISGLRFLDKWLHELGKEKEDNKLMKGLTGF